MQLRGQSWVWTHKNSLHQSLPTPISLCRCLPLGRLSDYCVGMEREQWIHSSLENLQQPIWLSTPIRHTAHHPLVLRIERVRRGGLNMSTKQWPPPSEPWRHTWMPDGEANYVFFLVGAASLREHFITGGNHETARGIPIPEFGMKCVQAQPRSAALKHQTSQCSSSETRQKKTGLFCWGKCYARVHHRLALVMEEIPARRPLTIVTRSWAGSSWLVDTRAVQRASNRTLLLFSLVTILYCQSTIITAANGVGRHFQYPISALPTTRCGDS